MKSKNFMLDDKVFSILVFFWQNYSVYISIYWLIRIEGLVSINHLDKRMQVVWYGIIISILPWPSNIPRPGWLFMWLGLTLFSFDEFFSSLARSNSGPASSSRPKVKSPLRTVSKPTQTHQISTHVRVFYCTSFFFNEVHIRKRKL